MVKARIIFQLASFVSTITFLILAHPTVSLAAQVGCARVYDGDHISDDLARELWPSGYRPALGGCNFGIIRGRIEPGDSEKVRQLLSANYRTLTAFYLFSEGGDAREATKIGAIFRKYLLAALAAKRIPEGIVMSPVPELCNGMHCICASACALVWFGAVYRQGTVGLHRPRIDDPIFKTMTATEATQAYKRVLTDITRYLDEMEVLRPIVDTMISTDPADIRWVDAEADALENPPSYSEWVSATCGRFSPNERSREIDLWMKSQETKLTAHESLLLKMLTEKRESYIQCERKLVSRQVDRMTPP